MPDTHHDVKKLLDDIQQVLQQQKELFGDMIVVEADSPKNEQIEPSMPPKKKQIDRPIPPVEEKDLFGKTIPPSTPLPEIRLPEFPKEPWTSTQSIEDLNSTTCDCTKCALGSTRTKFVFGVGNPHAEIVIVGEAPGAEEDLQGEPFVGRAGQLLNKILEAIHLKREEVYICNILKCRPPGNRDPHPDEVDHCEPYLWKQLELIKPKIILCLGRIAGQTLLRTTKSLGDLRGTTHNYRGIKLMVTYHPAALLRNPNWKRPTWEDVQQFRKIYDEMIKGPQNHA
ncbi:MAG: uracil-DNA glycosylase [bacterium]